MNHESTIAFSPLRTAAAWGVHLFTASGLLAGFMALLAINNQDWQSAMWWLLVAQFIDGIDGTLARLVKVREVLPFFNGKNLDYVVDFVNYAIVPAYFFYWAGLAEGVGVWIGAFAILLSSAIYYGKEGMVADEQYFVGFPVLWNWVVYYLFFVFQFPAGLNIALILFFAVLHFVPIQFAYPSRARHHRTLTWIVTGVTGGAVVILLYLYPEPAPVFKWITIAGAAYFGVFGVWTTLRKKR